jgi:peroxiredoxin
MRRLTLTGKPLTLSGKTLQGQPLAASQFKGKVLLVVFWASYAQPFTDDLKTISEVYAKHQKAGFEILGVNMDTDLPSVAAYLKQNGITWQSLREAPKSEGQQPGDFSYGIVSVPTMFIVNKEGLVEGGITASNLEYAVDALIQGKKLEATPAAEGEAEVAAPKTGAKRDSTADKTKARN